VNLRALRARHPEAPALRRFARLAHLLTGDATAPAERAIEQVAALRRDLRIPPLRHYGMTAAHFGEVADAAARASSMRGNPVTLAPDDLHEILRLAL
jgi:alcohol dehydrogenase class IV